MRAVAAVRSQSDERHHRRRLPRAITRQLQREIPVAALAAGIFITIVKIPSSRNALFFHR